MKWYLLAAWQSTWYMVSKCSINVNSNTFAYITCNWAPCSVKHFILQKSSDFFFSEYKEASWLPKGQKDIWCNLSSKWTIRISAKVFSSMAVMTKKLHIHLPSQISLHTYLWSVYISKKIILLSIVL